MKRVVTSYMEHMYLYMYIVQWRWEQTIWQNKKKMHNSFVHAASGQFSVIH